MATAARRSSRSSRIGRRSRAATFSGDGFEERVEAGGAAAHRLEPLEHRAALRRIPEERAVRHVRQHLAHEARVVLEELLAAIDVGEHRDRRRDVLEEVHPGGEVLRRQIAAEEPLADTGARRHEQRAILDAQVHRDGEAERARDRRRRGEEPVAHVVLGGGAAAQDEPRELGVAQPHLERAVDGALVEPDARRDVLGARQHAIDGAQRFLDRAERAPRHREALDRRAPLGREEEPQATAEAHAREEEDVLHGVAVDGRRGGAIVPVVLGAFALDRGFGHREIDVQHVDDVEGLQRGGRERAGAARDLGDLGLGPALVVGDDHLRGVRAELGEVRLQHLQRARERHVEAPPGGGRGRRRRHRFSPSMGRYLGAPPR